MSILKEVPTKTAPMREAIILTLAKMARKYGTDEGFLSSQIMFEMEILAGRGGAYEGVDWDMRGPYGKAYERAHQQLRDEGIIVIHPRDPNYIEYILAIDVPEES